MASLNHPKPEPFSIHVPDEELQDLKRRLENARIVPNEISNAGHDPSGAWAYGADRTTLSKYVKHWLEEFDWRKQEAAINEFSHFLMEVKGLRMHFIHQCSQKPDAIPLLLCHGWPGSVVEFLSLIPRLTEAGFHVIAPSIPGFAWSEAPKERGADTAFMAEHMHQLMLQLGYDQYAAQGGDWGSLITHTVAHRYPQHCVALHLNMCIAVPPRDPYGFLKAIAGLAFLSPEERAGLKSTLYFMRYETAYQQIQGTKPQSLAYGMNDSPVGLLGWLLEKFQSWSDAGTGGPEAAGLTKDMVLTNVMVYWVTQTIASSFRIYYETLGLAPGQKLTPVPGYTPVPTGVVWAKSEIFKFPRFWASLNFDLRHWNAQPKGGHFFAFEQPEAMATDIIHFFKEVVDFKACKANPGKPGQGRPFEPGKYVVLCLVCVGLLKVALRLKSRSRL